MSVELIIITAVSAFNLICSIILLTMYKNAITELDELKKVKTEVEEISSVVELDNTAFEPIKEEDLVKTNIYSKTRPAFKFSMIGLTKGDVVTYVEDDNIKAYVESDNTIKFRGEITSLSKAAKTVWKEKHPGKISDSFCGPRYWAYKDRSLDSIRNQKENNL